MSAMEKNRLQELLADLHRELSSAAAVDPESHKLLDQVLRDIQQLSGDGSRRVPEGAIGRLRQAGLRLEAEHPQLANAVGQLTDTLAKLGI